MNKLGIAKEFARSLNEPGIEKIILFGSVARGEETEDSDIDLLITCRGNRFELLPKIMDDVFEFLSRYGEYISVKVLSVQEMERMKSTHFISVIEREGIEIG